MRMNLFALCLVVGAVVSADSGLRDRFDEVHPPTHPPHITGEEPTVASVTDEEPTKASATNEEPTVASVTDEEPTEASATNEEPTVASVTDEEPTEASATDEEPTVASVTDEEPTEASATNEEPTVASITSEELSNGFSYANEEDVSMEGCNRCLLQPVRGPCRSRIKRFYYHVAKRNCYSFIFGGCKGNGNNFKSYGECMKACRPKRAAPFKPFCNIQFKIGPCKGRLTRYYFNINIMKCMKFIYGGCSGNENNFKTLGECKKTCG